MSAIFQSECFLFSTYGDSLVFAHKPCGRCTAKWTCWRDKVIFSRGDLRVNINVSRELVCARLVAVLTSVSIISQVGSFSSCSVVEVGISEVASLTLEAVLREEALAPFAAFEDWLWPICSTTVSDSSFQPARIHKSECKVNFEFWRNPFQVIETVAVVYPVGLRFHWDMQSCAVNGVVDCMIVCTIIDGSFWSFAIVSSMSWSWLWTRSWILLNFCGPLGLAAYNGNCNAETS